MLNAPKKSEFPNRFGHAIVVRALSVGGSTSATAACLHWFVRFAVTPTSASGARSSKQGAVEAHRRAVFLALLHGYDFEVFRTPQDVHER